MAYEEFRTYTMMVLAVAPVLIDARTSRNFLERAVTDSPTAGSGEDSRTFPRIPLTHPLRPCAVRVVRVQIPRWCRIYRVLLLAIIGVSSAYRPGCPASPRESRAVRIYFADHLIACGVALGVACREQTGQGQAMTNKPFLRLR
jgi:hypothetical protein